MLTKVTSKEFEGLVNPYTGEPMTVYMNVRSTGSVLFTCPDTFSTTDTADDTAALYDNWNRKNGVSGLKTGQPIVCAYTGKPLSVSRRFGKLCYSGGFDPHMFYPRSEFLYYAWMRDGVSKYPKPVKEDARVKSPTREGEVTDRQKAHANASAASLDEEKVHMIEKSMSKFKESIEGSSTVSMSTGRGHKRGK